MSESTKDVLNSVAAVLIALADLRGGIAGLHSQDEFARIAVCISELEDALHQQFEVLSPPGRRSDTDQEGKVKIRKVQRSLRNKTEQLRRARELVDQERAEKVGGRIANLWFVRAGLTAPPVS